MVPLSGPVMGHRSNNHGPPRSKQWRFCQQIELGTGGAVAKKPKDEDRGIPPFIRGALGEREWERATRMNEGENKRKGIAFTNVATRKRRLSLKGWLARKKRITVKET